MLDVHDGMGTGMAIAMVVICTLVIIALLLGIAALIRYLRS